VAKPGSCVEAALTELCAEYGYCLPDEAWEALLHNVPPSADAFVDAVLVAEGRDPVLVDALERDQLREVVRDWLFDDGDGRGTKSGLPRTPASGH
jgi:hypothetical protein